MQPDVRLKNSLTVQGLGYQAPDAPIYLRPNFWGFQTTTAKPFGQYLYQEI